MITLKSATILGTVAAALCVGMGMGLATMAQTGQHRYQNQHQPVPAPAPATVYRVMDQRNGYAVGVSCGNGGDPTIEGNFGGNGAQEWRYGGTGGGSIEQARIDLAYAQRIRVLGAL